MSDAEWDAEDRDPTVPVDAVKKSDKWEGEDEDDDVKDAWDKSDDEDGDGDGDEDTEKAKDGGGGGPDAGTGAKRGKKKLAEKIAEREERMVAEMEAKAMALTPEAKLAEKMRLQKLEETANLQMARDMLGIKTGSVDNLVPVTKEDFDQFAKAVSGKITLFNSSEHYGDMVESVIKEISIDLNSTVLRKIKLHIEGLHSTKLKEEKASKAKGKGKTKGSSVRMELDKELYGDVMNDYDDGMEDFM